MSRAEEKQQHIDFQIMQNAYAIYQFCIANDISSKLAMRAATLPMEYAEFVWFFNISNKNFDRTMRWIKERLRRIEENRIKTCLMGKMKGDL